MVAEVIVVGRGLLGAAVARRLADGGASVTVVEGGKPVSDPPGSHVRNAPDRQADPDGFFGAIDAYFDYLDRAAPSDRLPGAFTTDMSGGLGIVWTNNCPRAVPGVDRPDLMSDEAWERYYSLAERHLLVEHGVGEGSKRQAAVRDRLRDPLRARGRQVQDLPFAGTIDPEGRVRYVGPADIVAEADDAIEERSGTVERIERTGAGVSGVVVDGERLSADHVVVAAGAIETPLLLRRSGFDHPALGRHLSYHPVVIAQVVLDPALCRRDGERDLPPRLMVPPSAARPWHTLLLRDTNPLPVAASDREVAEERLLEIQVFAPVEPRPEHRLVGRSSSTLGFEVALSDEDRARMAEIERDVAELCGQLGRFRRGGGPQWAPLGTPHLMGSTRLGRDEATSVADPDGRVWGTDNLYVATNGAIPNRLAVNPTLTAAALAMRTVDQILGS